MSTGYADVLVGLQYGDEGKAKVIDLLAGDYDVIARFNGGANAGHTVETPHGRVALKQVPSGVFHESTLLYVGSGCVVSLEKLVEELETVGRLNVPLEGRLWLSDRASVVQPHHVLIDAALFGRIGTTKNGIGAAYADRALRMVGERVVHVRLGDLYGDRPTFLGVIRNNLEATLKAYPTLEADVGASMRQLEAALDRIAPFVQRDGLFLHRLVSSGRRVLFEGAQSSALDVVHGTVPYVTSSHTLASAAYIGGDLPARFHRKTIGVAKAVMSRVGNGPFVSEFGGERSEAYCGEELPDGRVAHPRDEELALDVSAGLGSPDDFELGRALRVLSEEYGTGTKRPRRVGRLDLFQLGQMVELNGVSDLYLNKCDVLTHYARTRGGTIPLVVGYELDGRRIEYLPLSNAELRRVQPVIEQLPAFGEDIGQVRSFEGLPPRAAEFVREVEVRLGCAVRGLGVGPQRDAFVSVPPAD